jgi:FkbM family methyltransferase
MAGIRVLELLKAMWAGAIRGKIKPVLKGFKNPSFAQFGEDVVLTGALPDRAEAGFYVDVGSFHPTLYSNTFSLYLRGWKGVLIEPNPAFHGLTRALRPRDRLAPCGVGLKEASIEYFHFGFPAFNTFSAERAASLEKVGRKVERTEVIPVKPLAAILAETGCPPKFELLNVDCEGFDLEVLQSNDWAAFRPATIVIEDHPLYREMVRVGKAAVAGGAPAALSIGSEIHTFLTAQGYVLTSMITYSTVYRDAALVN